MFRAFCLIAFGNRLLEYLNSVKYLQIFCRRLICSVCFAEGELVRATEETRSSHMPGRRRFDHGDGVCVNISAQLTQLSNESFGWKQQDNDNDRTNGDARLSDIYWSCSCLLLFHAADGIEHRTQFVCCECGCNWYRGSRRSFVFQLRKFRKFAINLKQEHLNSCSRVCRMLCAGGVGHWTTSRYICCTREFVCVCWSHVVFVYR